jgi:hypothetical protein
MQFCRDLFIGKSGDAENTTFTILSPDGREPMIRTHRGAKQIYENAAAMAEDMNRLAARYPGHSDVAHPSLPITLDARLGLDVSASDGLPLVVVLADSSTRPTIEAKVSELAWRSEFIGRFTFAAASTMNDILNADGITIESGIVLIEPDTFGQKGRVVKQLVADASSDQIADAMRQTLVWHTKVSRSSREHRAEGIKQGAFWIPKLPVTDREERSARDRTLQAIESNKKSGSK